MTTESLDTPALPTLTRERRSTFLFLLLFVAFAGIIVLGFLIRQRLWLILGGLEPDYIKWAVIHYYGGISPLYINNADKILAGNWAGLGMAYPPGYPAFLALLKAAGITSIQHARLAQALLDAAMAVPLWYVLVRLGTTRVAALAGALFYALAPWWAVNSVYIMAESLLPALVVLVLALMCWTAGRSSLVPWFATGLLAAFVPLVRPEMILLAGPLMVWALLTAPTARRWQCVVAVFCGFALPVLAWGTFNWWLHGEFLVTTNAKNYNLWSGLGQVPNDYGYIASDEHAIQVLKSHGLVYHSKEAEAYWLSEYLKAWHDHPLHVLRTIAVRVGKIMLQTEYNPSPFQHGMRLLYRVGPFVTAAAVLVLLRRRRFAAAFLVAGPLFYAIFSLGLVYIELRYVRYASLTYLLAAVVLVDMVWRAVASRLEHPAAGRVGALACLGAALAATPWIWINMSKLNILARDAVLGHAALAASGSNVPPARNDLPQLTWTHAVPGVETTPLPDGGLRGVSSKDYTGYQLMAISPLNGAAAILVDYRIAVEDGSVWFGILSGDGSHFFVQQPLPKGGPASGRLVAGVGGDKVYLVVTNDLAKSGRSAFRIEHLAITRLCVDETSQPSFLDEFLHPDRSYQLARCAR